MTVPRIMVIVECNTEETTAEKLLEEICPDPKKCIYHPRYGGIGRALKVFKRIVEGSSTSHNGPEIVGLISDLERGKIMETVVNRTINEIFKNVKPIEVYSHNDRKILLYIKRQDKLTIFSLLFDPWFEEVFSGLSSSFKKYCRKLGCSSIKRAKSQIRLREIMSEEPVQSIIKRTRTILFGKTN